MTSWAEVVSVFPPCFCQHNQCISEISSPRRLSSLPFRTSIFFFSSPGVQPPKGIPWASVCYHVSTFRFLHPLYLHDVFSPLQCVELLLLKIFFEIKVTHTELHACMILHIATCIPVHSWHFSQHCPAMYTLYTEQNIDPMTSCEQLHKCNVNRATDKKDRKIYCILNVQQYIKYNLVMNCEGSRWDGTAQLSAGFLQHLELNVEGVAELQENKKTHCMLMINSGARVR